MLRIVKYLVVFSFFFLVCTVLYKSKHGRAHFAGPAGPINCTYCPDNITRAETLPRQLTVDPFSVSTHHQVLFYFFW